MLKGYVLLLFEESSLGYQASTKIGYWDGKSYRREDVVFPGVFDNRCDDQVKVYKTKKHAENAVTKLPNKFTFVKTAEIESLDCDNTKGGFA